MAYNAGDVAQALMRDRNRLAAQVDWGDRLEALSIKELKLKKTEAKDLRAAALKPPAGEAAS